MASEPCVVQRAWCQTVAVTVDVLGFDSTGAIAAVIDATMTRPGPEWRVLILLPAPPECVGLVLPTSSQLLGMRLQRVEPYAPAVADLWLRAGDTKCGSLEASDSSH